MNEEDTKILENSEHIEKKDFNELKEYAIEDAKVLMPQMARDIKQLQWEKNKLKQDMGNIYDDLMSSSYFTPQQHRRIETSFRMNGVYEK